mmetsp:Transcript_49785/g.113091  ORF Transcript_49785/g.113091 Transcript_49785/m.113091 type:complete len:259 (-) Transcript_49785:367-1143(-)
MVARRWALESTSSSSLAGTERPSPAPKLELAFRRTASTRCPTTDSRSFQNTARMYSPRRYVAANGTAHPAAADAPAGADVAAAPRAPVGASRGGPLEGPPSLHKPPPSRWLPASELAGVLAGGGPTGGGALFGPAGSSKAAACAPPGSAQSRDCSCTAAAAAAATAAALSWSCRASSVGRGSERGGFLASAARGSRSSSEPMSERSFLSSRRREWCTSDWIIPSSLSTSCKKSGCVPPISLARSSKMRALSANAWKRL